MSKRKTSEACIHHQEAEGQTKHHASGHYSRGKENQKEGEEKKGGASSALFFLLSP